MLHNHFVLSELDHLSMPCLQSYLFLQISMKMLSDSHIYFTFGSHTCSYTSDYLYIPCLEDIFSFSSLMPVTFETVHTRIYI